MSRPSSAARVRASVSFVRLTDVSVATFDTMLKQLWWTPGTKFTVGRPNPAVPGTLAGLEGSDRV